MIVVIEGFYQMWSWWPIKAYLITSNVLRLITPEINSNPSWITECIKYDCWSRIKLIPATFFRSTIFPNIGFCSFILVIRNRGLCNQLSRMNNSTLWVISAYWKYYVDDTLNVRRNFKNGFHDISERQHDGWLCHYWLDCSKTKRETTKAMNTQYKNKANLFITKTNSLYNQKRTIRWWKKCHIKWITVCASAKQTLH